MLRNVCGGITLALAASSLLAPTAAAGPWLDAGDQRLRHDLQLLADEGLIHLPMQAWPLPAADVAYAVDQVSFAEAQEAGAGRALSRVQSHVRRQARAGHWRSHVSAAATVNPESQAVRSFNRPPREDLELGIGAEWMGNRFAYRLNAQWILDPEDDREWRADGSYAAVVLGNWMVSVDTMDRWWGPGWDGSLFLGNSARPFPKISVQRNYSPPSDIPVLSWIGPWRLTTYLGQLENRRDRGQAKTFGARLEASPTRRLQLGLATTAVFGGDDRSENLGALLDVYTGDEDDEGELPGYQLTGLDARYRIPWLPLAVYGQLAGQTEDGGSADERLHLFGAETWMALGKRGDSIRLQAEHADLSDVGEERSAYQSTLYPDGYTYRGRGLGHSLRRESEVTSLTATWVHPDGSSAFARAQFGEYGRDVDYQDYQTGYEHRLPDDSRWEAQAGWREIPAGNQEDNESEWYAAFQIHQNF